jgi:hypothetical protein
MDDYFEIVKICQELDMPPGADMSPVVFEYMKKKGQKPIGATELNRDELLNDLAQKHGKILSIETDSQGKQTYRVAKKGE